MGRTWIFAALITLASVALAFTQKPDRSTSLAELLKTYKQLGMPLPPADAKLVRFESAWSQGTDGKTTPLYSLGFLLRVETKERPALLLVGTQEYESEGKYLKFAFVEPKKDLAKEVRAEWRSSVFGINAGLATAMQCKARGWDELAQALWDQSVRQSAGFPDGIFYQPANLPSKTALSHLAWAHWGDELLKPKTDWAAIAKRMKGLLDAEPKLATPPGKALVRSLELALVPGKAKPGSVEALIDGLVDLAYKPRRDPDEEPNPRYQRLADLGFAAVPALIEHLDDGRLTRTVSTDLNNFPTAHSTAREVSDQGVRFVKMGFNDVPPFHLRVGAVVSDLLKGVAGEGLGKGWLDRPHDYNVDKAAARAWWKKAAKVGEETYLVRHVLPAGEKEEWPNQFMLDLLRKKYPKHLPTIYRTLLDQRPRMQSWPVAGAIAKSTLPAVRKKELFLHGTKNKDLEHRRHALWHLKDLDEALFVKLLIGNLKALPRTPRGEYWSSPEAALVHLVLLTEDRQVWLTLAEVAKRADVGLRMEFMNAMTYDHLGGKLRKQRLAFLAPFLDDATVRDEKTDPKRFGGPHAGFTFPSLAVRNFAAMQIAGILEMEVEPYRDWTKEQWASLREQVKKGLERDGQ